MTDREWLADQFELNRPRLRAVAYRMLGTVTEAEDAVQEAWLRCHRADADAVANLGGWFTTIVSRVSLDILRSRRTRREEPLLAERVELVAERATAGNPEHEALLADTVGSALLVVLDTLTPAERIAFVLHDMFAVPFDEIAKIVDRSPAAARQLASRARRRVQGGDAETGVDNARRREVVEAFFAASRDGEFDALIALLDPDVVLRADPAAVAMGSPAELVGANTVAETFHGRARFAELALIDGTIGAVWAPGGRPRVVFAFTIQDGKIARLNLIADQERLDRLSIQRVAQ